MTVTYDGASAYDAEGNKVGTVERTYIDDNGAAQFVAVKSGTLRHRHRLIPTAGADMGDDGLRLPYSSDTISDGPEVDPEDTLEGDVLGETRAYYLGSTGEEAQGDERHHEDGPEHEDVPLVAPASGESVESLGQVRDLGDVIEVPIVEERLVRQPYVKEVVRIRKTSASETRTVGAEVRRETVEVDADEGVAVHGTLDSDERS